MYKRIYINPKLRTATAEALRAYAEEYHGSTTPMARMYREKHPDGGTVRERTLYVSAARSLGWNIVKTQGHVYENGELVW